MSMTTGYLIKVIIQNMKLPSGWHEPAHPHYETTATVSPRSDTGGGVDRVGWVWLVCCLIKPLRSWPSEGNGTRLSWPRSVVHSSFCGTVPSSRSRLLETGVPKKQ